MHVIRLHNSFMFGDWKYVFFFLLLADKNAAEKVSRLKF